MLVSSNDLPAVIRDAFTDPRVVLRARRLKANIDGVVYGAIVSPYSAQYDNTTLSKADFDGLTAALKDGRIHHGFVIQARRNSSGTYEFLHAMETTKLATMLSHMRLLNGSSGEFWVLPVGFDNEVF